MPSIVKTLERGLECHRGGRWDQAESAYRSVLVRDPANPDALHLIGVLAWQLGRPEQAVTYIERAISAKPGDATFHYSLGNAWQSLTNLTRAIESYETAIKVNPAHVDAAINLGNTLQGLGRYDEAIALFRRCIELHPQVPQPYNNLGNALLHAGRPAEALPFYDAATRLHPGYPDAENNWGYALEQLGRYDEALAHYSRALAIRPDHFEALVNCGNLFQRLRRFEDALKTYDQARILRPNTPEVLNNIGNALQELGRETEALALYGEGIAINPAYAPLYSNRGNTLRILGRYSEAQASLEKALSLDSSLAEAHNTLGVVQHALGRPADAEASYRRALHVRPNYGETHINLGNIERERGRAAAASNHYRTALARLPANPKAWNNLASALGDQGLIADALPGFLKAYSLDPSYALAISNYLFYLHYLPSTTPEFIAAEHRNRAAAAFPSPAQAARPPRAAGPLRVGYVSTDFRNHSVAFFIEALLRAHRLPVFCYSDVPQPDDATRRLAAIHPDRWRNIHAMNDAQAARLIREDGIDLLIDLNGHTGNNRLPLFALRPAPRQATWIGYPNTTGIPAMDYRFTDAWADPAGLADSLHTEKLIRLAEGFLCYQPPAGAPAIEPAPARSLTFGSFNALAKINEPLIALWAAILDRSPGSRIVIKAKSLAEESARERLRGGFAKYGIDPVRVSPRPPIADQREHLAAYREIDVALDSFPYNGTTTTCEALWMGVPVVTLAGRAHVSRVGVSLLSRLGLGQLIAQDESAYIDTASRTTRDSIPEFRGAIRDRMQSVFDAPRFTAAFEQTLEERFPC